MPNIVIQTKLAGVAVNGLADDPEITILRLDTDAVVVNAAAMTDQGAGGLYRFDFTTGLAGIEYSFSVDADPNATGQVDDRNYFGAFDNEKRDIWNARGLNPPAGAEKTITENTVGSDYDEAVTDPRGPDLDLSVVKAGAVTTIDRT